MGRTKTSTPPGLEDFTQSCILHLDSALSPGQVAKVGCAITRAIVSRSLESQLHLLNILMDGSGQSNKSLWLG